MSTGSEESKRPAVRVWQGAETQRARRTRKRRSPRRPKWAFIFDTETTTDASQRLRVGCFRITNGSELVHEGLFYEHLSDEELVVVRRYADEHELTLVDLTGFREWLFHYGYRLRATIVGFNLPFDLSRLAVDWSPARGFFHGGWSMVLWPRKDGQGENTFRPRLRIKAINNRATLIDFTATSRDERDGKKGPSWRGRFLDLRTLAAALSDRSLSLDAAAETFGTEHRKLGDIEHGQPLDARYLDYLRRDVLVTHELHERLLAEYERHPIALDPSRAYSSASIGKAYLEAFGITPPLERSSISDEEHGFWLSAFFGGRAECHIRKELVPVTYLDVLSMYPTVYSLMGLQALLISMELSNVEATEEVRDLIERITLDDLFNPALWPQLVALVEVEPEADILPVRTIYGGTTRSIGVNYFSSDEIYWYSLADVVASKLLTGKAPKVRSALRLQGEGRLEELRPVSLRGEVEIDPTKDEIFRRAIEERKRVRGDAALPTAEREGLQQFLKTFANGTSYGINAELNRQEPRAAKTKTHIYSRRSFPASTNAPELPGRYCFPPFAAVITGAARLILAMLERCVVDAGGSWVFCDTDSMAVVTDYSASEGPGEGQGLSDRPDTLSIATVEEIVARFSSLSPYQFGGSILKIEDENYADDGSGERVPLYAYAVSAKRYVLLNFDRSDGRHVRKVSEHGLGTYQPPHSH